jgi:hypothetical protein
MRFNIDFNSSYRPGWVHASLANEFRDVSKGNQMIGKTEKDWVGFT